MKQGQNEVCIHNTVIKKETKPQIDIKDIYVDIIIKI